MNNFNELFNLFKHNNKNLYFVGGCVRDILLGRYPKDYDFTTDALPEEIKYILKDYKIFPLGERFGTICALINNQKIEITTHRKDMTSGRHPNVSFTANLIEDLCRRDFSINAMAMTQTGLIINPPFLNCVDDLRNKIIRTVGKPRERFTEDPLRMLRAIRFSSQLDFNIEEKTLEAIRNYNYSILSISRERWLEEMNKLLLSDNIDLSFEYFRYSGLLGYILPEVFPIILEDRNAVLLNKNLWLHTLTVVKKSKPTLPVRWAALLHDIGKPQTRSETGQVHYFGHEEIGADLVNSVARRLCFSNELRASVRGLVLLHQRIGALVDETLTVSLSGLRRLARECEKQGCRLEDLIELFAADCSSAKKEKINLHEQQAKALRKSFADMCEEDLRPRLPSGIGKIIMEEFNLPAGPKVGKLRNDLEEMLLDGRISINTEPDEMMRLLKEEK